MLRDMWNAMIYVQKQYPNLIRKVEWLSFQSGFSSEPVPGLIGLIPFDDDDQTIKTEIRNWVYYDRQAKMPRGILVARLLVDENFVFIVEIQRRARVMRSENGQSADSEESFQGLVFTLEDTDMLYDYLSYVLQNIRHKTGVFQKLTGACHGSATTFSHKQAGGDIVPCHAMVINALRKIGVNLERQVDKLKRRVSHLKGMS